jgi:WD40 repeat protein
VYGRGGETGEFVLVQTVARAHRRIAWSASWAHDDALLATGARDGTVKIWTTRPELQEVRNDPQGLNPPSFPAGFLESVSCAYVK